MSERPSPPVDGDELSELQGRLGTRALGRVHRHFPELGSTNDEAMRWASEGRAMHGALVTADAQTAGRGRLGRDWASPRGAGIYASVVLRPPVGADALTWGALGLAVAVGLREGLIQWAPEVRLKWPNDLLCGGRKLAGILCETRWSGSFSSSRTSSARPQVVVGFGINVGGCPPAVRGLATCLSEQVSSGATPGRAEVLAAALESLERVLDQFFGVAPGGPERGFSAIRGRYEPFCATLGRVIEIPARGRGQREDGLREVRVIGLTEDGALWVEPRAGGARFRVDSVPP